MARKKSTAKGQVWVLSGPLLDRLGRREPAIYGRETLSDIQRSLGALAAERGYELSCRQSPHEGQLIEWLVEAADAGARGVLINPGAYTHTSYALYDAVRACGLPTVEVHLSNPEAREPFRHRSCIAPACLGKVAGFGANSYRGALALLLDHLEHRPLTPG
jgi:3-dehydroquinate dehydratase II